MAQTQDIQSLHDRLAAALAKVQTDEAALKAAAPVDLSGLSDEIGALETAVGITPPTVDGTNANTGTGGAV